jgi:hypothetical protein
MNSARVLDGMHTIRICTFVLLKSHTCIVCYKYLRMHTICFSFAHAQHTFDLHSRKFHNFVKIGKIVERECEVNKQLAAKMTLNSQLVHTIRYKIVKYFTDHKIVLKVTSKS